MKQESKLGIAAVCRFDPVCAYTGMSFHLSVHEVQHRNT